MRRQTYPAEATRTLRRIDRGSAEVLFADAVRAMSDAEKRLSEAREAEAAHVAMLRPPAYEPGARAAAAAVRRDAAHARAHAEVVRRLRRVTEAAEREYARRQREVEHAREMLRHVSAEEQVIERDRDRFDASVRKAREEAAEAETDDTSAARRARR